MSGIASRIRSAREKKGLTTYQAAELAGVSQSSWSDWENGTWSPRGANRLKIAAALEVDAEWLRTGEDATVRKALRMVGTEELRRALQAIDGVPAAGSFPEEAELVMPETMERIPPFLRAVEGYLGLLHQDLPLVQRINAASTLISYCESLGLDSPDRLTLEQLHEALAPAVFHGRP